MAEPIKRGPGRPKGSQNQRTKDRVKAIAQMVEEVRGEGILPATLLLQLARQKWLEAAQAQQLAEDAHKITAKLLGKVPLHQVYLMPDAERKAYEEARAVSKGLENDVRSRLREAQEAGRDAAPYFHAKLASLDVKQKTKISVGLKEYPLPPAVEKEK